MGKPKLSTILLSLALIGALVGAVVIFLDRNKEQARRIWVEDQLEKIKAAKVSLEQERDELAKVKETLETQLTDANTQAKKLSEELATEKRSRDAVSDELNKARTQASDLNKKMQMVETEKKAVSDELARAKQSYQALSNELTTLRQAKEALERRVKEMLTAQSSDAERIVVNPAAVPGAAAVPAAAAVRGAKPAASAVSSGAGLEGKVLVVNKEFNFVVVNIGAKDGLQSGSRVEISRSGKKIGSAQVERLYDNMAAATVLIEEQKGQIKEGDLVQVTS